MRIRLFALLIGAWMLATAGAAYACSGPWVFDIRRTTKMVADADLILRVTAASYAVSPDSSSKRSSPPQSKVRFTLEEVVKGKYAEPEMDLPGVLTQFDEWNSREAPYIYARSSADAGCYTYEYRSGGQFLLILKRSGKAYSTNWLALSPVNEQLHSTSDPWLLWVREKASLSNKR